MFKYTWIISISICIFSQLTASYEPKIIAKVLDDPDIDDDIDTEPFTKIENKFYHFGQGKVSWFKATLICRSLGGNLASFDNQQELTTLSDYLKAKYPTDRWWWLSGSDLHDEGDFYWYRTGERFTHADWSAGQPDNNGGNENCVHLWFKKTKYQMNDWICTQAAYYICEADKPKSVVVAVF